MMSEAQLPATAARHDADDERHSNAILAAASEKARSNSVEGDAQHYPNSNIENGHYPSMTYDKALASDDSVASAVLIKTIENDNMQTAQTASVSSAAVQSQQHHELSLPQMPENQSAKSNYISTKNDVNSRHPKHINTVNADSLSRKNQVDNTSHAMSAPMSVLGANSDRSDFFRGGGNNSSTSNHYNSNDKETPANTTLGKVKSWFAGGDKDDTSDNTALDYREFSTPGNDKRQKQKNTSDEYIEGDVELAINASNNNNDNNRRRQQYNDEEESVMRKCSFAYGSDSPETYKLPHKVPSIVHQYSNETNDENDNNGDIIDDEENQEYFGRDYQNRRINPHAMAHALTSRAKRTWTERRYRRRLRQSQFIPPNNNNNNTASENGNDIMNGRHSPSPTEVPSSFHYELTPEHRHAFLAAHAALNGKLANEQYRNRHANLREDGFENDLQFDLGHVNDSDEEVRADLTKSSLAIRGGLIRLPVDNVRLVCDEHLQPGILSIETRDMGGENGSGDGTKGYEMFGNANRYGNIHGNMMIGSIGGSGRGGRSKDRRQQSERIAENWKRHELAYVLTVDEHIYQRVAQEMGDANRVPCGIYFCCHETEGGGNHVGIEVAVLILLIIFILLVAGMIAWPTW
jgi:hypothetical protein